MSKRLWLVRHGCTVWNEQGRFCGHSDIALAPEGQVQARWVASRLARVKIAALYTSDLVRARETAALLLEGRALSLLVQSDAAWRELDFGAWEGLTYAEIASRFPEHLGFFADPETHYPPGGESLEHLHQRVLSALGRMLQAEQRTEGDLVLVSHGGPLRVLLSSLLGMPLARHWQLALEPGSLSALDLLPLQEQAQPQGTLALLNMHRSLASLLCSDEIESGGKADNEIEKS